MKTKQKCRGCLYNNNNCHIRAIKRVPECPCLLCLVKVTCRDKNLCDERKQVLDKHLGYYRDYREGSWYEG
jgi:hypothetical protein